MEVRVCHALCEKCSELGQTALLMSRRSEAEQQKDVCTVCRELVHGIRQLTVTQTDRLERDLTYATIGCAKPRACQSSDHADLGVP